MTDNTCPTVIIKTDAGPVMINEADFIEGQHERVVIAPLAPPPIVAPPPAPPPGPLDGLAKDWVAKSPTEDLKRIAAAVNDGRAVENREQAVAVIKQALAARK